MYSFIHKPISMLISAAINVQNLYDLGARRIGVTTLPPTGCLPAAITLFGRGTNECVAKLNKDAISFNKKLNRTSQKLRNKLPGIKLVVFDIYQPLFDLITKPAESGNMLRLFLPSPFLPFFLKLAYPSKVLKAQTCTEFYCQFLLK